MSALAVPRMRLVALVQGTLRAIPRRHVAVALGFALLWGLVNALGYTLGRASGDGPRAAAYFVYEALLPMLLLTVAIGVADAVTGNDPDAVAAYAIAAVGAAILGEALFQVTAPLVGLASCGCEVDRWPRAARPANMLPDSVFICAFITAGYRYRRRASLRLARLHARELDQAQITRRMVESRLQAMQACIEPQFLFDTLGAVERLHATDPRSAAHLIDELINYLRAALPHLRDSASTVTKEVGLAHAWLNIRRLRDGRGPRFTSDVSDTAATATMPPMLVLPLVDYALGEAAQDEARCALVLTASTTASRLRFEVATHGCTHAWAPEADARLAGVRERLAALYGDDGTLTIATDVPGRLVLTLDLPHERADRDPR
ncbi:MAG: histidine kinase [Burkholderiales bacterium]|nr:histidine kinase [Burkholderiales bacterium]